MSMNSALPLLAAIALATGGCVSEASEEPASNPPGSSAESKPVASNEPVATAKAQTVIALDGEGVRFVNSKTGSTQLLAFGTDRNRTETALAAQLGKSDDRSSNEECGAGRMEFSDFGNFTANFQEDRFVGWSLRGGDEPGTLTTMSGIGIGTTRSEMAKSVAFEIYEDSTIGTEFNAAGLSGLLESEASDAKITDLWAGTNCIFR